MGFASILYRRLTPELPSEEPEFFRDLNLDQIAAAATKGKEAYDLLPFFYGPLDDPDDIRYRQEIVRDLENAALYARIGAFAEAMDRVRSHLRAAKDGYYPLSQERWFLDAALDYCTTTHRLSADLSEAAPRSRGFSSLLEYLRSYAVSHDFEGLLADAKRIEAELASIRYNLQIRGLAVTVSRHEDEADYSAEIEATFAKFRQGDVTHYRNKFSEFTSMNHVEAQIVERLAKLYPDIFRELHGFCETHRDFADPVIMRFDREVQFYLSYLRYIGPLKHAGLPFCHPQITRETNSLRGDEVFDLALADKLAAESRVPVLNDFRLDGPERVIVVSGPNQGGKTTLARTFGQLHYLASLGLPVPGTAARLFLCDRIFTHFEREEKVENLRGKLRDDLLRIHRILDEATPESLIIMNEIFASTALDDAVFLGTKVMERILALGCLGLCVTFLDELSGLGEAIVGMVSTVVPEDPAQRTFKLVRRPADGRAYAMAIAEKYRLGYRSVKERLAS